MYRYIFFVIYVLLPVLAMAETCVKAGFNITYSCGEGTLISGKTLPTTESVDYGKYARVGELYSCSSCNPPSGKLCVEDGLFVNDEWIALDRSYFSGFTYYYSSDMVVAPYYISESDIADVDQLRSHLGTLDTGGYNVSNGVAGEWVVATTVGVVRGKSKCGPEAEYTGSSAAGFVPENQDAIEDAKSGIYCYCKITEPDVDGLWVFYNYSSNCSNDCAKSCALSTGSGFYSGMLSGVM